MGHNKGWHGSNGGSHKGKPYVFLFVIICGAALLGVMVLHKLRERRIYSILIKEKDHQLLALQLLLQKERDRAKELRGKNEEVKAKILAVRSQKAELARTVARMQSTMDSMKEEQKVMESTLEEKQNELRLRVIQAKGNNLGQGDPEIKALRQNLKQKEAEIKDLKQRLNIPVNTFPEFVTANGTMKAQDKIENGDKEKDGNSGESARYGGNDKHVTNEDTSRSTMNKFKDGEVTAEMKDAIKTNVADTEDSQDGGSAGVTAKDNDAQMVKGTEKTIIREENQGHLQNDKDGGGQGFNVKRKHGHVSRTKGKRWRTIVNNSLMENNGNFASHGEVNKDNRKVFRDEKDVLKDGLAGRNTDEESSTRESRGRDKNNTRKDKLQAKLLKLGNDENREDGSNTTVETANLQVISNGTNAHSEEHGDIVQKNWSKRHINKTSKSAEQTKSNMLHEEPEELEVSRVRKQEKDASDDGDDNDDDEGSDNDLPQKSQFEFEDGEEYREEIDESEFQPDL